ncbi:hypothetical protein [Streptomyces sp. 8N706]
MRAATYTDAAPWTNADQVGAKTMTTRDEPAVASHAGKLYVM